MRTGDYQITLADTDTAFLKQAAGDRATAKQIDVADKKALLAAMQGQQAVISALPFFLNPGVAEACGEAGVHYFDLTEDVATTRAVRKVASDSKIAFVPQCGLAPGFISIVGHHLAKKFDSLRQVHMRVGALAAVPGQRAQIQSHLVDRRPHQRILQPLRSRSTTAAPSS